MLVATVSAFAALAVCAGAIIAPVALMGFAAHKMVDAEKRQSTRQDGD